MLFSYGQVQTSESIEKVFDLVQDACEDIGTSIKSVDRSSYQITGKSTIRKRSIISIKFYIVLHGNPAGTIIEIYDEYCGMLRPDKSLIEPLFKSMAKNIPFTSSYVIDKAVRQKTKDDLIVIENVPETLPPDNHIQNFKKLEYDVYPVGKYSKEEVYNIRKLMISLEDKNELVLSEDWNASPIFKIPFKNINDVKIVATNESEINSKNDLVLSITFSTNDVSTPYVASPISIRMTQENIQTILIDVDYKEINPLLDMIRSLKQIDDDDNSKLQLKASIQGITLCMGCHKNDSVFLFSNDQLCGPCFKER